MVFSKSYIFSFEILLHFVIDSMLCCFTAFIIKKEFNSKYFAFEKNVVGTIV